MDDDDCPGIQVLEIAGATTDGSELVITLAQPLGCPECGQHARTWVIPLDPTPPRRKVQHRRSGDPGE